MKKIIIILAIAAFLSSNIALAEPANTLAPSLRFQSSFPHERPQTQGDSVLSDVKLFTVLFAIGKQLLIDNRPIRAIPRAIRNKFVFDPSFLAGIEPDGIRRDGSTIIVPYSKGTKDYEIRIRPKELLKGSSAGWKISDRFGVQAVEIKKAAADSSFRMAAGGGGPSAHQDARTAMLADGGWSPLLEELRSSLQQAAQNQDQSRLFIFLDACNEAQASDRKNPIENRYPILHAVTLLSKEEKRQLIDILLQQNNQEKRYQSAVTDSILLMLAKNIPQEWLNRWAGNMEGRTIWDVSSEAWNAGGGLGRVIQYRVLAMLNLLKGHNTRIRTVEPHYQENRDGTKLSYESLPLPIENKQKIDEFEVKFGMKKAKAICYRGIVHYKAEDNQTYEVEAYRIEDEGGYYTKCMYKYGSGGHNDPIVTWEDFSAFFSTASLELMKRVEEKEMRERQGRKPPVIHFNDSQLAPAVEYYLQDYYREPSLRDALVVFQTHTIPNRQDYIWERGVQAVKDMGIHGEAYAKIWLHFGHHRPKQGGGWEAVVDWASAGIRDAGLALGVSRQQLSVIGPFDEWKVEEQGKPYVDLIAATNGDLRELTAIEFRRIMRQVCGNDVDVEEPTVEQVLKTKQAAKKALGSELKRLKNNTMLTLNPDQYVVSYSGRLVPEKVSRTRAFTNENIEALVKMGVQVIIYGNVQNSDPSRAIERELLGLERDLKEKGYLGKFIFIPSFTPGDQRLLLAATDIQAQVSDPNTEAAGATESDIAACAGLELAPHWREGILQAQGIPINLDETGEGSILIPREDKPESYLEILTGVLSKKPPELAEYQATSVRLSRVLEAVLTSAENLRQYDAALSRRDMSRKTASGVSGVMKEIHRINLDIGVYHEAGRTFWHVIPIELVPYPIRNKFIDIVARMNRDYPDAPEKIKIVTEHQDLFDIAGRLSADNDVDVALSRRGDIDKLPDGVKALVFEGELGNFRQLEGVLACLRALSIKNSAERSDKLSRLYKLLTGEDPKKIPDISDPKTFARNFIFILPPIAVENYEYLRKLNSNLLHLIESA